MDLSLSASQLVSSTLPDALLTPFAELDHFIALCETPARALPRSDSDQPHHTTIIQPQDLYIVVPKPPKHSKPIPINVQDWQSMISQENTQEAGEMVVTHRTFSFAFLNPRIYINFIRMSIYPFIAGIILNIIRAIVSVLNMVKFLSVFFLSLAKAITMASFQVIVYIISSFLSFLKSILLLVVRVNLSIIGIISSIWRYIDSIPLINLYLKPIYYLGMLSAIVGSVIGISVGFIVLAIRYLIPTTSKKTKQEVVARNMIKSFKNSLSIQQHNLRQKSRVPSTTKIKQKERSDFSFTIMTSTAPEAVNSTAVPVNPISLSTTTTLNKKNNATSATTPLLGKHEACSSNHEEKSETVKTISLSSSFKTEQPISGLEFYGVYTEIPSITPPMYEDEDGYSNYFLRSAALEEPGQQTSATSPTLQSPTSEVRNAKNHNFGSKLMKQSKSLPCGNENGNIDEDDDDDNTNFDTPKPPARKFIYKNSFESLAEESN